MNLRSEYTYSSCGIEESCALLLFRVPGILFPGRMAFLITSDQTRPDIVVFYTNTMYSYENSVVVIIRNSGLATRFLLNKTKYL